MNLMPTEALKAMWTVRVGLWPGEIEMLKEHHKCWYYTSADYAADAEATRGETPGPHPEKPQTKFQTCSAEATAYWSQWNDPMRANWAELSFVWV